jgi:GNAT superfamily N-acetyltransferase
MISCEPLIAADLEDWRPLWQGYLSFYKAEISAATTQLTFARLTGGKEPMGGFIARDAESRAIGITHWIVHRSCWSEGDHCYLQDLFVAPAARNTGAGRVLIEKVYEKAVSTRCAQVYWLTHESNSVAMKLYDKVAVRTGFVEYSKTL